MKRFVLRKFYNDDDDDDMSLWNVFLLFFSPLKISLLFQCVESSFYIYRPFTLLIYLWIILTRAVLSGKLGWIKIFQRNEINFHIKFNF